MKVIVFLGPDGAGKSSLIRALNARLASTELGAAKLYHFRPIPNSGKPPVTDPYRKGAHPLIISFLKVLFWVFDFYRWRISEAIAESMSAKRIAFFDRYLYDVNIDHKRYRVDPRVARIRLDRFLWPRPDFIFILEASAETLQRRKKEVTQEQTVSQRNAYRTYFRETDRIIFLNAENRTENLAAKVEKLIRSGHENPG